MRIKGRQAIRLGLVLALLLGSELALTGVTAAAVAPSLTATARFGKAGYASGETVTARLTVHNTGSTAAHGITASDFAEGNSLVVADPGFGPLGSGATIPAGGHVTVTVSGHFADPGASSVTFAGDISDRTGNGLASFAATAPVTLRRRTLHGQVFKDKDADGRAGAGEGFRGAKVSLRYLYGDRTYAATAGAGGRFTVVVPRGRYYVTGGTPRWTIVPRVSVVSAHSPALKLRAVRPLGKVLKAALHFTKARYKVHEIAHVVITLENTGSKLLRGIAPSCNRIGNPNDLYNTGRGWGRLALERSGVTLAPHRPRTFEVTARVPRAAQRAGFVAVVCDFGYPAVETGYRPTAAARAKVPGQFGALAGQVFYFVHGRSGPTAGLAGVRVVLADSTRCPVYRRKAATDAHGRFHIGHAPAGPSYELYFFPPKGWKVRGQNPTSAFVFGKDTIHLGIQVVPGTRAAPTVPKRCG